MKSAFRNAVALRTLPHYHCINPHFHSLLRFSVAAVSSPPSSLVSPSKPETFRFLRRSSPLRVRYSSMTGGETDAPTSMEKQFEDFRVKLDEAGSLRERIRAVVNEIESISRLMHASLLHVHQSRPLSGNKITSVEVLEKPKAQVDGLKELYGRLAEVLCECPGEYYRFHNDWRSETQTVVSLLAFMHWLETGKLLMHTEAEEKLGMNQAEFALDIEDYLIGLCFLSNEMTCEGITEIWEVLTIVNRTSIKIGLCIDADLEQMIFWQSVPRYVVNQVLAGNYDCPRKVLRFLTDLHAAFRMLNLRNDFLRKKFDSLKYDLKRVEEVYYDMKIRHLANGDSAEDNGTQGQS
ncbi:translin family protein [Citrus sinensis]|nr:translin family protein [Citrus sinensis]